MQEGISNVFQQAGCGTPAVQSLLGEGGVTEGNMMQYLGIVEQRTNEILQVGLTSLTPPAPSPTQLAPPPSGPPPYVTPSSLTQLSPLVLNKP